MQFLTPEGDILMLILAFLAAAVIAAVIYVKAAGAVMWKGVLVFAAIFVALNLVYILFVAVMSLFVSNTKPLVKQNPLCRSACVGMTGLILGYCWVRTHITGLDKLPDAGRFVFISNHRSGFDPLIVLNRLKRYDIAFISKPSNMALPFVGRIAHGAGCLSIDRENDRNALTTILQAADYIKRGVCSVGIYPEGTRSRDGALLPFHAGSFKIAQRANVPLAVACIRGSESIAKNALRRVTDVYLDILELIPAERVKEMSTHELADYSRALIERHLAAAV